MRTFTKTLPDAPRGFFAVEAAGLHWLAEVDDGAHVARPCRVDDAGIELPFLDQAPATTTQAEAFGRALARTHGAGAPAFGCPPRDWSGDGYIGPLPLPHGAYRRWGEFYSALRLRPYARRAHSGGALSGAALAAVDAVCARLENGDFDDGRPPARLHGDMWSGNVVWTPSGAVLIDPAAHGGHAETDLAMLALFRLPYLDRVLAAYDEAAPLAEGWRDRVGLHQLHPLLVHAVLFGGHYGARAEHNARRFAGR